MSIRIIRKALGLLIVDIVIIIGIFILQFRADSSIIEKIGNLQFTFSQMEDRNQNLLVQNKLRVTYNGLNFYFDDQTPAVAKIGANEFQPVILTGWSKIDDLSCSLLFSDDIKVTFELASMDPNASLAVVADLPSNVSDFAIPYNFSSNMKIQSDEANRIILNGKKASWEVAASSLDSGYFALSKHNFIATYSVHNEIQKFTFDSIVDLPGADLANYQQNIKTFKNNLISAFKSNSVESNLSEQVIVSYIAAQAENGNYSQAIEDVPSNLKKNKQRTYLSAPYLNTLEEMNAQLQKTINDYEKKITESASSGSLDIFTVHNISNYMFVHSNPEVVKKLLQNAASADIANTSLAQATGLLQVYTDLYELNPAYAKLLQPAMDACIERITESCSFEGNILTISENGTFLSVIQAVETGISVMRYGLITDNQTLQKAGRVLVDSYLTENSSYDLRTLANLYPVIAYDNWYYPHLQKIKTYDNSLLWAWTCAKSITYEKDADNSTVFTIDFPENLTHYIIIRGVQNFSSIYIYNMAFRTDPRFETYNSSGYVYKQSTQSLLLKSRHKQRYETIRLRYNEKPSVTEPVSAPVEDKKEEEKKQPETVSTENKSEVAATPAVEVKPAAETTPADSAAPTAVSEVKSEPAPAETASVETAPVAVTAETVAEQSETPAEPAADTPVEDTAASKKKRKSRKNTAE